VLFQICQWLVLVTLAHSVGDATVGQFAFALAVTLPPLLFASLNTRVMLATDVGMRFRFADYLALRVLTLLAVTGGVAVVSLLVCRTRSAALLIVLVAAAKCFDWISDIVYGLLQKYEMMDRIGVSRILQGVLQLAAINVAAARFDDFLLVVAVWAATSAAVTLTYDVWSVVLVVRRYPAELAWSGVRRYARRLPRLPRLPRLRRLRRLRRLFAVSLPLAGTLVVGGLVGNVPVYALQHWRSPSEVGVLAVQLRLVLAAGLCFGALTDVATPRLATYYLQRREAFRRLVVRLTMIGAGNGLVLVVVTVLLGGPALRLVYGSTYDNVGLAVLLAVSTSINLLSLVLTAVAAAAYRYAAAFRAALAQLVVTTAVAVALTARLGLTGAGIALLVGQSCYAGLLALGLRRLMTTPTSADGASADGASADGAATAPALPVPRAAQDGDERVAPGLEATRGR